MEHATDSSYLDLSELVIAWLGFSWSREYNSMYAYLSSVLNALLFPTICYLEIIPVQLIIMNFNHKINMARDMELFRNLLKFFIGKYYLLS